MTSDTTRAAQPTVRHVGSWLAAARAVTVLTGAGISTGSGIPDFRGPQGVWTLDPGAAAAVDIGAYTSSREVRVAAWRSRVAHPAWQARPNAAHAALVALERAGKVRALLTQNIDGLHQRAGSAPDRVLELHGTLWRAVCLGCGARSPMDEVLDRVRAGEEDPECRACGGMLKSDTVSFGQSLDPGVVAAAAAAARSCDVFVALGTSLTVHPAAGLCDVARRAGASLVVVNGQATPYDGLADAVLRGDLVEVLPALVSRALDRPGVVRG